MSSSGPGNGERDSEPIDKVKVKVVDELPRRNFKKRYDIQLSDGELIELRVSNHHRAGGTCSLGRWYELKNIELVRTPHKRYLRSTVSIEVNQLEIIESSLDLLVVGDTHIGYRHRSKRNKHASYSDNNCRKAFENLVEESLNHQIDGVIHTGDILDHGATREDLSWVKQQLKRLSAADIGFTFIYGNHDPKGLAVELTELDNVMHIGDGKVRTVGEVSFIGYDSDRLTDVADFAHEDTSDPQFVIAHPEKTEQRSSEISELFERNGTRCYFFVGHRHTFEKYIRKGVHIFFTGSPCSLNHDRKSTALRVQVMNGIVADETTCSLI